MESEFMINSNSITRDILIESICSITSFRQEKYNKWIVNAIKRGDSTCVYPIEKVSDINLRTGKVSFELTDDVVICDFRMIKYQDIYENRKLFKDKNILSNIIKIRIKYLKAKKYDKKLP